MVSKFGMSDILGPVCYSNAHDEVFIGRDFVQSKTISEDVASKIDTEVSKIVYEQYNKCLTMLNDNNDKLQNVADALISREKLSSEEFNQVFDGKKLDNDSPFSQNDITE